MVHWQHILAATAAASSSLASNLFVTSYTGTVTTYGLSCSSDNGTITTLTAQHTDRNCGASPSWLTLDPARRILYCLDEGLSTPNGSLNSYRVARDGTLTPISHFASITGPVSAALYGPPGHRSLAAAHYSGSAVSAWSAPDNATLAPTQQIAFTMAAPGPIASRQDAPHEHEAVLDPSGRYLLVPDLGADLVRVLGFSAADKGFLAQRESLKMAPGEGPRHVAFLTEGPANSTTYMFVVTELTNTVVSYAVSYPPNGGMSFREVYRTPSFGTEPVPTGAQAAEIAVTPDKRFLLVSNRNDTSFSLPNPNPANSTAEPSDSLATFAISPNGTLAFAALSPAGGRTPRHFQLNAKGDRVAVALQDSDRVVVWKRDVRTGRIGEAVARMLVGQPTSVVWDEAGCAY
ncbi:uncharacterized protein K452DRAFT_264171 [Aplosporella prunicola CBS 121167]|uniref:Lactonase family protein n=1 Tax=Aplosporella prunicola CBS 121167 TaxID=1176127 RepID=A0A6A6BSZ1_9PEZI|nr:uncharacterized protein K452DRAFT_264171 [Aplosporella prunicola CBS 121167]KAF2146385.1 hypothetical protein K452DRAFT_264171 [Aplosporella prunicola CBS 121167]